MDFSILDGVSFSYLALHYIPFIVLIHSLALFFFPPIRYQTLAHEIFFLLPSCISHSERKFYRRVDFDYDWVVGKSGYRSNLLLK